MSRTLNKVLLIGNVGKDPEIKFTPSGIPVISFRIATSESWKDKDGTLKEHTDWHTVVAWRGLAEVIQKLVKKGSRIYIEGKIQTRTFEDKSLNKRHVVEILAENMLLLENRKVREEGQEVNGEFDEYYASEGHFIDTNNDNFPLLGEDEIPF
jgi:single-strand DNA-binding protein